MKLPEMLPRSQPWDIFFYHVQILLRSVGHVRATESNRQGKHIYHRKEKLSQQSWDQNQEEKKVFGKNMLEMVGENNQKEKKKHEVRAGDLERHSVFCARRDTSTIKHGHKEAAPLLQDGWTCLQHPESFLISVHAQSFPSSAINLLMLF